MTDATPDPQLGRILGQRYRIDARIGAGASGTVYRARQLGVERDVALKHITRHDPGEADWARHFRREVESIGALRHPHIVALLDAGLEPNDEAYIVTELLDGRSLAERLQQGPVDETELCQLLAQLCGALSAAHSVGIVHRDLKPANVFLERYEAGVHAKLLDFGIARVGPANTETAHGRVLGSPTYMSPEQARGETLDARSDLYSLGVVAYECLAGAPPFSAPSAAALLLKHVSEEPPRLPEDSASPGLRALVSRLLEKMPEDRYPDALSVREALLALMPEAAPAPVAQVRRWPFALAGVAIGATAAALAVAALTPELKPAPSPAPVQTRVAPKPAPKPATPSPTPEAAQSPTPKLKPAEPPKRRRPPRPAPVKKKATPAPAKPPPGYVDF